MMDAGAAPGDKYHQYQPWYHLYSDSSPDHRRGNWLSISSAPTWTDPASLCAACRLVHSTMRKVKLEWMYSGTVWIHSRTEWLFRTGMKTFQIGTGIRGNQNNQKIWNFSGSKNLKEFFQNSKVLKSSYQTKPNLKSWNFEKILADSYSLKNFRFFGSFGFLKFQDLSGMFSFRFGTYSFRSGMNSYRSGIHSFRRNFSHSGYHSNYHRSSSCQSEVKLVYHTLPHICNVIIFVVLEFECYCVLVIYHSVHWL